MPGRQAVTAQLDHHALPLLQQPSDPAHFYYIHVQMVRKRRNKGGGKELWCKCSLLPSLVSLQGQELSKDQQFVPTVVMESATQSLPGGRRPLIFGEEPGEAFSPFRGLGPWDCATSAPRSLSHSSSLAIQCHFRKGGGTPAQPLRFCCY